MLIRSANTNDSKVISDIFNHYVVNSFFTFEENPISTEGMQQKISEILDANLPFLVIINNDIILGYCNLHNWNNRLAYQHTKELSIYLNPNFTKKGIGSLLLSELLKNLNRESIHCILSTIAIPNEASVALHKKFGFEQASHMKQVGKKHGEWRDIEHWELILD